MISQLCWKTRAGLVISFIWLGFAYAIADRYTKFEGFFFLGLLPVGLLWGTAWIISGFLKQRPKKASLSTEALTTPPTSNATKKLDLKKTGVALLICSAAIAIGGYYAGEQAARYVGMFITTSLITYFAIKAIPKLKPYAGSVALTVFSLGVVISSFNHQRSEEQMIAEWRNVAPLLAEINSGVLPNDARIREAKLGRIEPAMRVTIAFHQEFAKTLKEYETSITSALSTTVLSAASIGTSNGREKLRTSVNTLTEAIDNFSANSENSFKKYLVNLESATLNLPADYSATLMTHWKKSLNNRKEDVRLTIDTQLAFRDVLRSISDLVDRTKPTFQSGGAADLIFTHQSDANQYNLLVKRVNALADAEKRLEEKLNREQLDRHQRFLDELKRKI